MPTLNSEILDNYNSYLQTHNLVQSNSAFSFQVGTKVYPIQLDMFLDYLVDQIAMQVVGTKDFRDPLAKFYKEPVKLGTVIQDIQTVSGYDFKDYNVNDFEKNVSNPYSKNKPQVSQYFHNNVLRKKLMVTLTYEQLYSALQTEYGLNALISSFIRDLEIDYYSWEYKTKRALLSGDWARSIKILSNDFAEFAIQVKKIVRDFTYNDQSYANNRAVIPNPIPKDRIAIIISAEYQDKVDVKYFTGLFNMSMAEIQGRITYINKFDNPNRVCVICDERGLMFHKILDVEKKLENPADLTWNLWKHFWRNLSVSPNYNAVAIDIDDTINSVTAPYISINGVDYSQENNYAQLQGFSAIISAGDIKTAIQYSINDGEKVTLSDTTKTITVNGEYKLLKIFYNDGTNDIQKTYALRSVL